MKMLIGGLLTALMADGATEAHYTEHPKGFSKLPEQAQMPSPFRSGGGGDKHRGFTSHLRHVGQECRDLKG